MRFSGVYIARLDATSVSLAKTLVQVKPGTKPIVILRAYVDFSSTTSTVIDVRLKDASTDGTSTSFTPVLLGPGAAVSASAGNNHTSTEPTLGTTYFRNTVNYLSGFLYLPVPEERIIIAPSGNRFGIDFPSAPGSAVTLNAGIVWGEIG